MQDYILRSLQNGNSIKTIEFTLYYSSLEETVLLVDILPGGNNMLPEFAFAIRNTLKNWDQKKINVNDYVHELASRFD